MKSPRRSRFAFLPALALMTGCSSLWEEPPRTPEPDLEALRREAARPAEPNAPYGPRLFSWENSPPAQKPAPLER